MFITPVFTDAFALNEQFGTGLGNAYAGITATSEDASYQYNNPASMSFLSTERQYSMGGTFNHLYAEFHTGTTVSGGDVVKQVDL